MRFLLRTVACATLVLLASCGGEDDDDHYDGRGDFICTNTSEKQWLREEMNDWYFWAGRSPDPDPSAYADPAAYLDARRFQGDADEPRDRFSYIESAAAFDEFFVSGRTLGYGISVNGSEGTLPLKVRYVEPGSPAAAAGVARGDVVVSVNGVPAATLVGSKDFSTLSPSRAGDQVSLVLETSGVPRTVGLTAARYDLVPVTAAAVLPIGNGKTAGYLSLKDFVNQAQTPLAEAIAGFRAQGASELIVDLRYNGGGLVSVAQHLASLVTGSSNVGGVFTTLVYNARHQDSNATYRLQNRPGAKFQRVVVLTGPRTCSASEMVVNGLKPYVDVVTIGGTSCGKPVGFSPQDVCDNVYSLVNFESVNALGEGKYYNGLPLTCPVTDDFSKNLGDPTEKLTAAALSYLQSGACPVQPSGATAKAFKAFDATVKEPGQRSGMFDR